MTKQHISSVILDEAATHVLLALASKEGLLEEEREKTDAFLETLVKRHSNSPIVSQILEQVVLTPNILTFAYLPEKGLQGQLFDKNFLQHVPRPSEPQVAIENFSSAIIGGMISARGFDIPESELNDRLVRARTAFEEAEQYKKTHDREPPDLFKRQISEFIAKATKSNPALEYTEEEYKAAEIRQEAYKAAKPILDCMNEYVNLVTVAEQRGVLLKTSTYSSSNNIVDAPASLGDSHGNEVALFRIVANGLGKLTFRPTLEDSLKLAEEPATQALRELLPIWLDELTNSNLDALEKTQREIKIATSALKDLSNVKSFGTFTTWVAVPVAAVEMILRIPPIMSMSISLMGTGYSAKEILTNRKYRWATFGNT